MNKHSVTVQDLATNTQVKKLLCLCGAKEVLPSLSPPCEELQICHSVKPQAPLVQIQRCTFPSTLLLVEDSGNTKKLLSTEKMV